VLATMSAVAVAVHALVGGLPWAAAFALGAIVSPTDPLAATAIARRLGVPRRLVTLLEGESLVNDATALNASREFVPHVRKRLARWSGSGGDSQAAAATSRKHLAIALGGQRAGVGGAELDPLGELRLGAKVCGVDPQPSRHRPAAHLHWLRVRRLDQRVGLGWVDVHKEAALAACCHGHVAADQKGEPTNIFCSIRPGSLAISSRMRSARSSS
jgi:hypothetical protein